MKTYLFLFPLAALMTVGCRSDNTAADPSENTPAYPPNLSSLTNYPPAPLAPTGPVPQNNMAANPNLPPNVPWPANVAPPPTNRPAMNSSPPP
jgi:hypothetical protein